MLLLLLLLNKKSHWNSTDGTGSFNWRMKFQFVLPHPNPRLTLQIWDRDILSANDIVGEIILNLNRLQIK